MNDVKNKSGTACNDAEAKAIRKELRRTVQSYSKVIDMFDATPQFKEPTPRPSEPYSWRKLLKRIFKHFKI